jgi:hypothetical protein
VLDEPSGPNSSSKLSAKARHHSNPSFAQSRRSRGTTPTTPAEVCALPAGHRLPDANGVKRRNDFVARHGQYFALSGMTHRTPPLGSGQITVKARNQVNMQMRNGLAGGSAVIDADVVALRLKLFVQQKLWHGRAGLKGLGAPVRRQIKEGASVPFGYQQGVARRHRITVANGNGCGALVDHPR